MTLHLIFLMILPCPSVFPPLYMPFTLLQNTVQIYKAPCDTKVFNFLFEVEVCFSFSPYFPTEKSHDVIIKIITNFWGKRL